MKRFLPVALGALLAPSAVSATEIEEVVITSSPLGKTQELIGQPVNVLSGQALRDKVAATLGATLAGETGISSASFGPGVGYPVIRGQTGNRVKVLQDNLGTLDAASASPDHANSVEPLLAERIEVLRGPSTLRFGSGAIGGVVNVIDNRIPSRAPEQTTGAMELRHDSVNDGKTGVFKLDGGGNSLAWHLDGLYRSSNNIEIDGPAQLEEEYHDEHDDEEHEEETSNGFIANSNADAWNLTGGLSLLTEKGFWGFSVSRLENEYGIPPGAHEHAHEEEEDHDEDEEEHGEETVRIDMEQTRFDIKGEHNLAAGFFKTFKLRASYNDYQHTELEGGATGTRFDNEGWEGLAELIHSHNETWRGVAGIQWQFNEFSTDGKEAFIPVSDISRYGFFVVEALTLNDWELEGGLRAEQQDIDAEGFDKVDHQPLSLSASAVWHTTERHHITGSITRAQRAPSVEELFSNGPHLATASFDRGNAGLGKETSLNMDLGYRYHGEHINLSIQVFHNRIDDYIYQANSGLKDEESELPIFDYMQQEAVFKGIEAELEAQVTDQFGFRIFGDSVRATLDQGGDVPRITPQRVGVSGFLNLQNWDVTVTLLNALKQDHPGDLEEPTDGYTNLSATLNYRVPTQQAEWVIFLRGDNLLDERIRNATSFLREVAPEPGLNITIGTRVSF